MNINGIIYDENLQYFNMINQFANLSSTKPKLTILINDLINNDNEFPSSHERYLEDVFKITENQNEELKLLIKDAFEVTNIRRLSNTISANEEEKLIENLLSPNELVRKQQKSSSRMLNSANFEGTYCLINRFFDEYLYADANPYNYDDKIRNIFTFKTHSRPHSEIWELIQVEPYERFYYIKNKERGEFLYAESEDYAFDNDRRRVFTWIPKDDHNKVKFQWKVDFNAPLGEFFTILNREYQEYLYAFNGSGLNEYKRRIFTWRRKNKFDIQMLWKLVPC
ncbi:hypothetical protein PVAND_015450 [Polypedilum vanderplanki]|uniref:Uncharacterized protein n=1 Tax=Polypedilum vanderplanki TaxID=319348 RepID=A0A9J6BD35_POLVA|nr:hypothetical protein PVAND_015450 [Polypedilum vanderplanki]